ncbi:MAG: hypothetical protein IJY10_00550 [Lachnospiraceae bacterium]|nr:hypothetical protein [Lachnospiraceae bacterium]
MINFFNLMFLIGIMIPNILFAINVKDIKPVKQSLQMPDGDKEPGTASMEMESERKKIPRWKTFGFWVNMAEQVGRYACMVLMIVPLGVLEFGFGNVENFMIYTVGNSGMLIAYWVVWFFFFKERTFKKAMALALLPTFIFLLTALTLEHSWLLWTALLFGVAHVCVTYRDYH